MIKYMIMKIISTISKIFKSPDDRSSVESSLFRNNISIGIFISSCSYFVSSKIMILHTAIRKFSDAMIPVGSILSLFRETAKPRNIKKSRAKETPIMISSLTDILTDVLLSDKDDFIVKIKIIQ